MKARLIAFVKAHRWVYELYFYTMSLFIRILGIFVRPNKRSVLFVCFGGRSYKDNVRPVYEGMLKDKRFDEWKFIWAFGNPADFDLPDHDRTIKCKIDSLKYYIYALQSRLWITNVQVERGLNFGREGNFSVQLWHSTLIKYVGKDIKEGEPFKAHRSKAIDLYITESNWDVGFVQSAFEIPAEKIKITGYPRNDIMFHEPEQCKSRVIKKYGIDNQKKMVLYAPTFRDYEKDAGGCYKLDLRLSINKFQERLGDEYILLVRAHGMIENTKRHNDGFIDVSDYADVEDLLVASDVLVTDYSGILFDYVLLDKPVICFIYDYERYMDTRGLYVDIKETLPFPMCHTEEELYNIMKHMDYDKMCAISRNFKEDCGLLGGNSTERVIDEIARAVDEKWN